MQDIQKMNKIIGFIFRQHNIGNWWGAFAQSIGQVSIFLTLFNTLLLIPTAYVTWFAPWTQNMGLQIPITLFILVIFLCGVVVLLAAYKILTPSSFSFWNDQFWRHDNLLRQKLNDIETRQKEIKGILEKLEKQSHSS